MSEPVQNVGVREFRENSAQYLQGVQPIAVTRHGKVIGLYFPLPPDQEETKRAFARLGEAVDRVRAESGLTEEELGDHFNMRKPLSA